MNNIIMMFCAAIIIVGIATLVFQLTKLVEIDAKTRNIPNSKLKGLLAASGQRGEGLIAYLIYRNRYKIINITENQTKEMNIIKKKIYACIGFMAVAAIAMVMGIATL